MGRKREERESGVGEERKKLRIQQQLPFAEAGNFTGLFLTIFPRIL